MNKLLLLGKTRDGKVFVTVRLDHLHNLSITGVIGPRKGGNCKGGCGQIQDYITPDQLTLCQAPWTYQKVQEFLKVWQRWHLNNLRAGTPAQEQWLRDHAQEAQEHYRDRYRWACEALEAAGLNPDRGYSYGILWLREELPEAIEAYLAALPESKEALPEGW